MRDIPAIPCSADKTGRVTCMIVDDRSPNGEIRSCVCFLKRCMRGTRPAGHRAFYVGKRFGRGECQGWGVISPLKEPYTRNASCCVFRPLSLMANTLRARLRSRLNLTVSQTDAFLSHFQRLLSTSAGVESLCYTVSFTLIFVHTRLQHLLARRLERFALSLASKASQSLFPGETIIAEISPPPSALSEATAGVKALADLVTDFCFFQRLCWGLINVYSCARENYLQPPGDAILKSIVWVQVVVQATFQTLEDGAYLASKGVLRGTRWKEGREARWWVWSNRFWLAHVVLEGLRLLRVRQLRYNEEFGAKKDFSGDEGGRVKEIEVRSEALKKKWKRDWYANAGWLPLTLHWSFEDESSSPLNDTWVGISGIVPGIIGLVDAWEQTG